MDIKLVGIIGDSNFRGFTDFWTMEFSPDGRRIYFNESSGEWTRLRVIEAGG